ncbi:MAG: 4Fe-4S binding protein [Alphaproteobacteria bacterium]
MCGRYGQAWFFPIVVLLVAALIVLGAAGPAGAVDGRLGEFLDKIRISDFFPEADRIGPIEGTPPAAPVYKGDRLLGHVFLNSDAVSSIGYSGKPIHIVVGLDPNGAITGAELVGHSEPIVLVGIPEKRVADFITGYAGESALAFAAPEVREALPVDIVSGATVTIMVIDDSIKRSALKMARTLGLGDLRPTSARPAAARSIDPARSEVRDWEALVGDGSVRRLNLSIADVNRAFADAGNTVAASRQESDDPADTFIDLYTAPATVPSIGRSLLGEAEHRLLTERLGPGQHAVLIAANGPYSFKGSGYVRGGIFDRIQLIQGEQSARFRDRNHKRLGEIMAEGAPHFDEIGLFVIPEGTAFNPAEPWRLQLLVQRSTGAIEKAFTTFSLPYAPPERYLLAEASPVSPGALDEGSGDEGAPLWQRIWRSRVVDITVALAAIGLLTVIFFFQDWLVKRPRLAYWVRIGFLVFTVGWLGYYAQAQLSVVNTLTFANALLTDFHWDYFLTDPLIFILWFSVAASLLFWGRGAYCGWLCPFGALQELLNKLARLVKVPQLAVPWAVHERVWPVKYIIFLGLFGLSLSSLALAERMSEVEPFKTAIVLRFTRDWPFVVYAGVLLAAGLTIERFFCRYLCPLGAALAIPGRIRMFEWLKRYRECGSPCQICAQECMVQAIHPNGRINPNECLYCLHCQTVYWDDHKCPVMIERRQRRERRLALQSKAMRSPA